MDKNLKIDYHTLMDLRIDYAFKLLFTKGDLRFLISLLNAIFANKKIKRVIKTLDIKNPYLEKETIEDKLSILDIRAELEDGTNILIEMHMHGLGELKSKTIRSWARAYGEDLEVGKIYTSQPPTIAIAFANGQIEPLKPVKLGNNKIHRLCMIMDYEDNIVFTDAMELHYIDMKAFAQAVNENDNINAKDTDEALFSKWLSLITQKEINNKDIVENAVKEEEAIFMAVSTLVMQSEDKIIRQAYQRRKDEIYFYNKEREDDKNIIKQQATEIVEQAMELAEKDTELAKQAAELAKQAALIAKLEAQLLNK